MFYLNNNLYCNHKSTFKIRSLLDIQVAQPPTLVTQSHSLLAPVFKSRHIRADPHEYTSLCAIIVWLLDCESDPSAPRNRLWQLSDARQLRECLYAVVGLQETSKFGENYYGSQSFKIAGFKLPIRRPRCRDRCANLSKFPWRWFFWR